MFLVIKGLLLSNLSEEKLEKLEEGKEKLGQVIVHTVHSSIETGAIPI